MIKATEVERTKYIATKVKDVRYEYICDGCGVSLGYDYDHDHDRDRRSCYFCGEGHWCRKCVHVIELENGTLDYDRSGYARCCPKCYPKIQLIEQKCQELKKQLEETFDSLRKMGSDELEQ